MNSTIKGIISKLGGSALALANALLAIVNSVLYIHIFGVSRLSDALYYSIAVISSFCLLPRFFIEQFLQYYSDYRCGESDKAPRFLGFNIISMLVCGALLTICFGLFSEPLVHLLYPRLDGDRLSLVCELLKVLKYQLLFTGLSAIGQNLLVSEGKISQVYWGRILNAFIIMLGQTLIMLSAVNIKCYAYFIVIADWATALLYIVINNKIIIDSIKAAAKIDTDFIKEQNKYILDSFIVRFGHNMQDFFLPLITSAFWAGFSGNLATCYGYANKFTSAIQMVFINPSQLQNQYEISGAVSRNEENKIHSSIKSYLKLYLPLVLFASGGAFILIPFVLHLINREISSDNIQTILLCFCFLAGVTLIQCATVPFDTTITAKKKGKYLVAANVVYIAIVAAFVYGMPTFFYSQLISSIIAQLAVLIIYIFVTRKFLLLDNAISVQ